MADLAKIRTLLSERRAGHALPGGLYNDPEAFAFDQRAIFGRYWLQVGFEGELPKPGTWLAANLGLWPGLITRDRAGALHAFHNTCRHRGAQICAEGRGAAARLVCPYHRWTYELSGELAHAGRMPEDFDPAAHGLHPIRLESVGGILFVCFSDDPPDIAGFRDAFTPLLASHDLRTAKLAHEVTLVEKANWKIVMENARECYHCPGAHPELSRSFPTGASGHFDYGEDDGLARFNARMAELGLAVGPVEGDWWQAMRFALNDGCVSMTTDGRPTVTKLLCETGGGDVGSLRWSIEPHSFSHACGDYAFMFSAYPLSPGETLVSAKWYVHPDAMEGDDYEVERLIDLWNTTNLQDLALVENNQRGVNSPGFTPGPFSPEAEALALRFADWYYAAARAYLETAE
jgi:Rieske 2Fe-2S family protein